MLLLKELGPFKGKNQFVLGPQDQSVASFRCFCIVLFSFFFVRLTFHAHSRRFYMEAPPPTSPRMHLGIFFNRHPQNINLK